MKEVELLAKNSVINRITLSGIKKLVRHDFSVSLAGETGARLQSEKPASSGGLWMCFVRYSNAITQQLAREIPVLVTEVVVFFCVASIAKLE